MKIEALDHVNIRSPDIEGTIRFFEEALGMKATLSPGMTDLSRGAWICDGEGRAVVHLASLDVLYPWEDPAVPPQAGPLDSGRIHHVALRCSGYSEMEQRFRSLNLPFTPNDVPQAGLRQLFIRDPNGITFELNFFAD